MSQFLYNRLEVNGFERANGFIGVSGLRNAADLGDATGVSEASDHSSGGTPDLWVDVLEDFHFLVQDLSSLHLLPRAALSWPRQPTCWDTRW